MAFLEEGVSEISARCSLSVSLSPSRKGLNATVELRGYLSPESSSSSSEVSNGLYPLNSLNRGEKGSSSVASLLLLSVDSFGL